MLMLSGATGRQNETIDAEKALTTR